MTVNQVNLFPGLTVIRQLGGTAGTSELQIQHDGTNAILTPMTGVLKVAAGLTVTGTTTLATSLSGILKTTAGVVSGTAGIGDLSNVVITSPSSSQVLTYNGTNWVNGTGGAGALSALSDVTITTPINQNILYYNGTKWVNSTTGTTSGVQAWGANLDVISALSQGTANVIRSNGTVWQSVKLAFSTDLSGLVITTPSTGQIISYNGTNFVNSAAPALSNLSDTTITTPVSGNVFYYNGTKWVNSTTGTTSGIQAWGTNLDVISGLAQGTANVIRSNGTAWQSAKLTFSTDLTGVVITSATSGQLLTYNGTNWVNQTAAATASTLDTYFNSGNTITNRVDLTGTAQVTGYTYSGTGGAVVTSIHVANRDGTNDYSVDAIINDGTNDYYIGKQIPIPVNTSLEMLKRAKVLKPGHFLKFLANGSSKLQVTTTVAPYNTNTNLYNALLNVTTTSQTTVYTESNSAGSVIDSITIANTDSGTNGVEVTVVMNDGTNDTYLTYLTNVPQFASVEVCDGLKFLPNTGTIKVTASDASRCNITLSGRKL